MVFGMVDKQDKGIDSPLTLTQFDSKKHEEMSIREDAILDRLPKPIRQAIANADVRPNVQHVLDVFEAGGTLKDCIDFVNTGDKNILLRLI